MVSDGDTTSAPAKFEFKFLRVDAVPLGSDIVSSVVEDSTQGTRIALNGSDSDSKFVTFVITELPRMGKLYRATGEPIRTPFSVFEVRNFAPSCGFLDLSANVFSGAGCSACTANVRLDCEECELILASGPES